jgi:hypothetical protein
LSDYYIDATSAKNIAKGKQLYVIIIIDTTFTGATSIDFQLMTDDTTTVSAGDIMVSTGAIAIASLTAGRAPIVLPVGDAINAAQRYISMYYVLAGSVATAGAVTAFLAVDPA